jgi:hypothetical protein
MESVLALNRAFSAEAFDCTITPGPLPQAVGDVTHLWREHRRSPVLMKLFYHGSQLFGAGQTLPLRFAQQLVPKLAGLGRHYRPPPLRVVKVLSLP